MHQDRVRGGTITASSSALNLPAEFLQRPNQLRLVWRTLTGVDAASLLVDLGASYEIGLVSVLAYGGGSGVTVRVRLSTVDVTGDAGDAADTGTLIDIFDPTYRHIHVKLATPATGRYLKVDLSESGAERLQAGGLLAGPLWNIGYSYRLGWRVTVEDADQIQETRSGTRYVMEGVSRRRWSGEFPAISDAERVAQLEPLAIYVKRRLPVVFLTDRDSDNLGRDSMVGFLQGFPSFPHEYPAHGSWPVEFVELV